jgi:hypothetical protein
LVRRATAALARDRREEALAPLGVQELTELPDGTHPIEQFSLEIRRRPELLSSREGIGDYVEHIRNHQERRRNDDDL